MQTVSGGGILNIRKAKYSEIPAIEEIYASAHAFMSEHGKGVAGAVFDYCYSLCKNIRIDTHRDNLPMQKALEKNGFEGAA